MVATSLLRAGRAAIDLVYPPRCSLCGRGGDFLCASCEAQLPRASGRRCDQCWLPLPRAAECAACHRRPLALASLRSALRYEGDVRRLVHAFKFGGQSCLAPSLTRPLIECYASQALEADMLVPVPLTGTRRRLRGYNQAGLLAKQLSRSTGLPLLEPLRRRRYAGPQSRSASADERRRNVQGAFSVARPAEVAGARVLVVDDIATTCATLDACARVLLEAGATAVMALTLARED
jgi:ComF family protein